MEFHNALMEQRGQLNDELILRLAKSVGLDTERLKKDMESADVLKAIAANQSLAEELGVRGTPAFVIGGPFGLDQAVLGRADRLLALGPGTLPHELARVVLYEQLYRAAAINAGAPYHH